VVWCGAVLQLRSGEGRR